MVSTVMNTEGPSKQSFQPHGPNKKANIQDHHTSRTDVGGRVVSICLSECYFQKVPHWHSKAQPWAPTPALGEESLSHLLIL